MTADQVPTCQKVVASNASPPQTSTNASNSTARAQPLAAAGCLSGNNCASRRILPTYHLFSETALSTVLATASR